MTEGYEVLWCPTCKKTTGFLMSGSHTKGICTECETEIRGKKRIERLQDALAFDFMFAAMSNGVDK